MIQDYEIKALKKLGIPLKKWGDSYRVKVRSINGRYTYVANISRYKEQIAKLYPKATDFKKLKETILDHKPNYRFWKNKNRESHLYERYAKKSVFSKLEQVLLSQKKAFKLVLSLGYKVTNIHDGEERYWSPGPGTYVFDEPIVINSKADIQSKIMNKLRNIDFASTINYPNSGYKLEEISAFHSTIYPRDHRLGDSEIVIPKVITDNRQIVNHPKTNNKCVFHCIANFLNPKKDYRKLIAIVKTLFKQYCAFKGIKYTVPFFKSFEGVDILQFDELEDCFKLNINVFEMDIDTEATTLSRASNKSFEQTISILDYRGHAMWIPRIEMLENRHVCEKCDQIFASVKKFNDHKRTKCDQMVLESFVKEPTVYCPPQNKIKSLLVKHGLELDHYIDHFIVYDFEAILSDIKEARGESTTYTSRHIPVSVSICDSLTKEVRCFVSDEPKDLLKQMFEYVDSVGVKIREYNIKKFEPLIRSIMKKEGYKSKKPIVEAYNSFNGSKG